MTRIPALLTTAALTAMLATATAAAAQTQIQTQTPYLTAPATQDRVETVLTSLTIGNPADLIYRP
jgi:alpha-beta hydrolase superfamily lysophospholipase